MRIFSTIRKTVDSISSSNPIAKPYKLPSSRKWDSSLDSSTRRCRAVKSLMSTLLSDDADAREQQAGEYLTYVASQQSALRDAFRGIDRNYDQQHTGCVHLSSLENVRSSPLRPSTRKALI